MLSGDPIRRQFEYSGATRPTLTGGDACGLEVLGGVDVAASAEPDDVQC